MDVAVLISKNNIKVGTEVKGYKTSGITKHETTGTENTGDNGYSTTDTAQVANIIEVTSEPTWRYMGMDADGNVMIMADVTDASPKMTLSGTGGFMQGASVLNDVCDVIYSSSMGKAENMNLNHVIKLLAYDGPKYCYHNANTNKDEYSDEILTYQKLTEMFPGKNIPGFGTISNNLVSNGITIDINSDDINEKNNTKYVYQSVKYWLSNTAIILNVDGVDSNFGNFMVTNSKIWPQTLTWSDGYDNSDTCALRPVVTLMPNVLASYSNGVVTLK